MGRHQLTEYLSEVLPAVQAALCDADAEVREAAGSAFAILFKGGAGSAVDSVVPTMVKGLEEDATYDESLEGLRVILSVRPQFFNGLVGKLLKAPVQVSIGLGLGLGVGLVSKLLKAPVLVSNRLHSRWKQNAPLGNRVSSAAQVNNVRAFIAAELLYPLKCIHCCCAGQQRTRLG